MQRWGSRLSKALGTWAAFRLLGVLAAACLVGCSTPAPRASADERVFDDRLFSAPSERIDASELFALTPEMRRYLQERIAPLARRRSAAEALIEALYMRDMLHLEYDSAYTRNAREAFEARMGNCLSLVIMTAAFAREMNVPVRFQDVPRVSTWDRNGDLYFQVGHVNLMLGPTLGDWRTSGEGRWTIIDFLPGQRPERQRARPIDESRIRAMFMNNRAAEAMTKGRLNDAYWWARGAFAQDPAYPNTFNTLGVIYRRHGDVAAAERALRQALALDVENVHAMGNLVSVLQATGRDAEAAQLQARLKELRPAVPYELFNQGLLAIREGDYRKARDLFEREIELVADNHEFHFWLAVAHSKLGDTSRARKHLQLAVENSNTRAQQAIYAAKLQQLKSMQ